MTKLRVTEDEVHAAQIEVQALRSAGLEPDPIVVRIAELGKNGATAAANSAVATPSPSLGDKPSKPSEGLIVEYARGQAISKPRVTEKIGRSGRDGRFSKISARGKVTEIKVGEIRILSGRGESRSYAVTGQNQGKVEDLLESLGAHIEIQGRRDKR